MALEKVFFRDSAPAIKRADAAAESLTAAQGREWNRSDVLRQSVKVGLPLVEASAFPPLNLADLACRFPALAALHGCVPFNAEAMAIAAEIPDPDVFAPASFILSLYTEALDAAAGEQSPRVSERVRLSANLGSSFWADVALCSAETRAVFASWFLSAVPFLPAGIR